MDQNRECTAMRNRARAEGWLPLAISIAVLISGFNGLVQVVRTLAQVLGR